MSGQALPASPLAVPPGAEAWIWEPVERVGQGATAVVFRVTHAVTREPAALKLVERGLDHVATREITLLGQLGRRWGPTLLDAGIVSPAGLKARLPLTPGAAYLVMQWAEGEALGSSVPSDRARLAARVAHGVGRALEELHDAGVRHGDVKSTNVLVSSRQSQRDVADDKTVTLVDLGLADAIGATPVQGGTPRYLAPEVASGLHAGPAADLFALGILLGEILVDEGQALEVEALSVALSRLDGEPARWAEALLARAPGGRPGAGWIADRASRWLGLARVESEESEARQMRLKRAYVAARARELSSASSIATAVGGRPRAWLEDALSWRRKIEVSRPGGAELGPMTPLSRTRWLVSLVGPSAACWLGGNDERTDGELAEDLLRLAGELPPVAWTAADVLPAARTAPRPWGERVTAADPVEESARLVLELARPLPDPRAIALAEERAAKGKAPAPVVEELASALLRAGETGRAWTALSRPTTGAGHALRAEVARRRGEPAAARDAAMQALTGPLVAAASARATLARLAWDEGMFDEALGLVGADASPAAVEIRGLVAYSRGRYEEGARAVADALGANLEPIAAARLEGARGMLEHARGDAEASLAAFTRAMELAARQGAVLEEATYLTGAAAAATDAGDMARALVSATRAALLWERLGQPGRAARAWLNRADALSTLGALHACDEAAAEATERAWESGDHLVATYARFARAEVRRPGDPLAREEARLADQELAGRGESARARAAAQLLVFAPDLLDPARIAGTDEAVKDAEAPLRWEWWGARARARLAGHGPRDEERIQAELLALVGEVAPVATRGPALAAGFTLALQRGDGDAARRFALARAEVAKVLLDHAPPELLEIAREVEWVQGGEEAAPASNVELAPGQVAQLESIVRALATRDRLRPLLEQVLDTMILWSGVERGLLLLRAPDGRLVPRAARNLAKKDLSGEQLSLSQGIARRALETGEPVVATDAFASLGDILASVHALRLRSVLAVPLIARGESLGVVYLDDRARRGAFGPREIAWVRLVASQAAMAIADARDHVLLRRAVRRAERAQKALLCALREKDVELDATRSELARVNERGMRHQYETIVGRSEPMRRMLGLVDRVTSSEVPVLVVGESGTGKELVARALHTNGPRGKRPFVSENCGSIPESLLESALFGHVKGAFTGASSSRAGLFEVADGGTLFLDEIGEMPLSMQAKLLRVLQGGEIRPVGGDREWKVDVRIIGATNKDLETMVRAGTFREDLFYRLNVITIRVPPLRERAEDIPLLVSHLVAKHAPGRRVRVTRGALDRLAAHPWPGNVRQLENEIRRALVLVDEPHGRIDVSELSREIAEAGPQSVRSAGVDLRSRIDKLEREALESALVSTRGNQTQAARLLGLSRFGLQKMLKRLDIDGRGGARAKKTR